MGKQRDGDQRCRTSGIAVEGRFVTCFTEDGDDLSANGTAMVKVKVVTQSS